jgi:hypothetical protein
MIRVLSIVAIVAAVGAGTAAGRPGPPREWGSTLSQPTLRKGGLVVYRYQATSADALRLQVSLMPLPRQLRATTKTTAWTLEFPGEQAVTRRVNIRLRVKSTARVGSTVCLRLLQHAFNPGVDDVVQKRVCARVRR